MSAVIEIPIKFQDQDEPSTLRDADIIKKCPVLIRSLEMKNPDWATAGLKLDFPVEIPFGKAAGDFIFTHAHRYVAPDMDKDDPKLEEYKEANEKTLDELKQIIECANYLEITSFMHCVGFVIAKKLEEKSIEEIAQYFGVECKPEAHFFDEADGWIHAPKEIFENNQ